jgi:DNA-binding CsgD family transcriptional regulator
MRSGCAAPRRITVALTPETEGVILALWRQSYDTFSIARHVGLRESTIYNRLLHIRTNAKVEIHETP